MTAAERCRHDLIPAGCAWCSPRPGVNPTAWPVADTRRGRMSASVPTGDEPDPDDDAGQEEAGEVPPAPEVRWCQ